MSVVTVLRSQVEVSAPRADHSSRAAVPSVMCLSVIGEPHGGGLGPLALSIHEKKIYVHMYIQSFRRQSVSTILL
jgi:hypothetical protein